MNIAICLSGMPRNVKNSFAWLKESVLDLLIDKGYNHDIFISTWHDKQTQELLDTFKPKLYDSEHWDGDIQHRLGWDEFKNHRFEIEPRISCLGQFYKIWKCNELRKQSEIDYDIIMRYRTELKFNNTIDLKELEIIKNCNQPIVFLRKGPNPNYIHWYKDNFAIMNKSGSDIYCDTHNNLLKVSKSTQVSTAELILRNWLDLNQNLLVEHTSLDYTLTRE